MKKHRFNIGNYIVDINSEPLPYNPESADNANVYDAVYLKNSEYQQTSTYEIALFMPDELLKKVLIGAIGGGTCIHKSSHIIEDNRLTICCSNTVFCLSVPDLLLLWKTEADYATCFEIFKYQSDYIIHGEIEISRLSHSGDIVWQQSGADIFVTLDSSTEGFIVAKDHILATDWNGRKYTFDFDGKILSDQE